MTRRIAVTGAVLAALAVSLVVVGVGSAKKSAAAFKVAFIYVGPHNDGGWSQAHENGRLYVQKMLGSKVETTYKENIAPGAQFEQTVSSLAAQGYQMIFATSFGYLSKSLVAKYPKVLFEQATGVDTAANMSEYFGAGEDSIFLSGIAAGAASKSGNIGYIVPFPIPEVLRHANAFALGAQLAHPGAKVSLIWTHSWFDPAKEKKAAQSLISAGADVLGQNVDSPAAGQYAESQGVPWVGYDSDASNFAPKSWLTAAVYNWGPYYLSRVKAAMAGSWKPGFYYGSMKDGFTGIAKFGPSVSAKTKALIAAKQKAIVSGSLNIFQGPVLDQNGKTVVAAGKHPSVMDLYAVNYLVKGIVGSPKG